MADILDEVAEFAKEQEEEREVKKDLVKQDLLNRIEPLAAELEKRLLIEEELESKLKSVKAARLEIEESIRAIWGPFLSGASKAELALGNGHKLQATSGVSVKNVDLDKSSTWLIEHGYESCMKYQIHVKTLEKIAREEYDKGTVIPGLQYFNFTKIKIK